MREYDTNARADLGRILHARVEVHATLVSTGNLRE
jgi:hypothetical protein